MPSIHIRAGTRCTTLGHLTIKLVFSIPGMTKALMVVASGFNSFCLRTTFVFMITS
jgi:hypothetical protein